jgi:hypothetical protein
MSLLTAQPVLARALTKSAVARACPARNDNHSKTLDEDEAAFERRWTDCPATRGPARPCRNGTIEYAPLWNGPRLRPDFVAQVLGQVMMDRREQAASLARVAYGRGVAQIPAALLLDDNI